MARLIPNASEAELVTWRSRAESDVYRACRTLRDGVVVIHGLATLAPGPQGAPRDGEADFVVLDPLEGLLVVEVKGGGVARDANTKSWTSISHDGVAHPIRDPFAQARDRKHDILQRLRQSSGWSALGLDSLVAGHAVLLPEVDDVTAVVPVDAFAAIVGGRGELKRLEQWIGTALRFWAGNTSTPGQPLGPQGVQHVERVLCASFSIQPRLGARIEQEEQVRLYWTENQWQALQGLRHWSRVAVAGGAGTGKTLLALRRAQELAAAGQKTLVLCFNAALGDSLKEENLAFINDGQATRDNLHTFTFHELCRWWIGVVSQQSGRDLLGEARSGYPGASTYDVHLPAGLAYALSVSLPGYDAIVIDEGQDFRDEYWLPIELMNPTTLAIFYDPNQALFELSMKCPIRHEATYFLTRNCRNTDAIHDAAYRYYRGPEVRRLGLAGAPIRYWEEPGLREQALRIAAELRALKREDRVPADVMAVLVLESRNKQHAYQVLEQAVRQSQIQLAIETHGLMRKGRVLLDTVARFKGLEAAIVVVWLNGALESEEERRLLYVALSRPKSMLVLVGTHQDCDAARKAPSGLALLTGDATR